MEIQINFQAPLDQLPARFRHIKAHGMVSSSLLRSIERFIRKTVLHLNPLPVLLLRRRFFGVSECFRVAISERQCDAEVIAVVKRRFRWARSMKHRHDEEKWIKTYGWEY